jgi:DNA-binding transcriptional LysR family regulator
MSKAPSAADSSERFTLHELKCFDALVRTGSFQAAADSLHRTHPAVFAAVRGLERKLGLQLLDRAGYRVALTAAARSFHARARALLQDLHGLHIHAAQLAMGEESELRIVIGDLCPLPQTLGLLRNFFNDHPATALHLHFEAISGPWERLFDGDADLILHHVDKSDQRLEFIDVLRVRLIPVVAPGFLPFSVPGGVTPRRMLDFEQCVIRDTARHSAPRDYFVLEGARHLTVADQLMKKEVILQSMGWGHMPDFLVKRELQDGRLLSIAGRHFPGGMGEIVAARRRDTPHGPVAEALWRYIEMKAAELKASARSGAGSPAVPRRSGRPR